MMKFLLAISLPRREFLVVLKKWRMFERTASANCCLDMFKQRFAQMLVRCHVQRPPAPPWKPSRSLICPAVRLQKHLSAVFITFCLFEYLELTMSMSKELAAFNIDAILASTADQPSTEAILMEQFVKHDRGLKAYESRYEFVPF